MVNGIKKFNSSEFIIIYTCYILLLLESWFHYSEIFKTIMNSASQPLIFSYEQQTYSHTHTLTHFKKYRIFQIKNIQKKKNSLRIQTNIHTHTRSCCLLCNTQNLICTIVVAVSCRNVFYKMPTILFQFFLWVSNMYNICCKFMFFVFVCVCLWHIHD